jgi:Ser/Thr protein kinase RdoA (MazF antagonist)
VIARTLVSAAFRRAGSTLPIGRLLVVGELAVLAGRHLARLDRRERSRLLALLRRARGRPSSLSADERRELGELVARIEPRAFAGHAVRRLSPVPVPRRVLEGGVGVLARALRRGA